MANILISYYSDYGEVLYDAISEELLRNGNNVFRLNINNPKVFRSKWGGESEITDKALYNDIIKFSPDIILNFNHSFPQNCQLGLKTDCKICILDADNPETFWNKKLYQQNKDKYLYLGLQSYSKKMYEDSIGKNLTDGLDYLYFPPATMVKNKKCKQDKNISFIGSNFYPLNGIPPMGNFYHPEIVELYKNICEDYYFPIEQGKEVCKSISDINWAYTMVRGYLSGQYRLKFLQSISDIGLVIYGDRNWEKIRAYDFDLEKCYDKKIIKSLEDNQWVYNTSKISINISHPQAKTSFSWRVMDIMASNSCLLMEDKPDWRDLFEKYLSTQTIKAIIYKDRFDMREKAIKLLKDDKLRQKCVAELNNAIAKNGRWKHRMQSLQKFLNINLMNLTNKSPEYIYIQHISDISNKTKPNQSSIVTPIKNKKNFIQKLKLKQRVILTLNLLLLMVAQIPIIDFMIPKKKRMKLHRLLETYKR